MIVHLTRASRDHAEACTTPPVAPNTGAQALAFVRLPASGDPGPKTQRVRCGMHHAVVSSIPAGLHPERAALVFLERCRSPPRA
eukprot:5818512-Prymnesium_polylepis.3